MQEMLFQRPKFHKISKGMLPKPTFGIRVLPGGKKKIWLGPLGRLVVLFR